METTTATTAAPLPVEVMPAPRKSRGRPPKYFAPTDGSPVPRDVQEAIKQRERDRIRYYANPTLFSQRNYENYKKRMEKMHDAVRQLNAIKAVMGNAAVAVA